MASSHRILTSIIRKQRLDGVCNMHYINERGIHSGLWEVDIEDMVVEGTIDIKRWLRNNTGLDTRNIVHTGYLFWPIFRPRNYLIRHVMYLIVGAKLLNTVDQYILKFNLASRSIDHILSHPYLRYNNVLHQASNHHPFKRSSTSSSFTFASSSSVSSRLSSDAAPQQRYRASQIHLPIQHTLLQGLVFNGTYTKEILGYSDSARLAILIIDDRLQAMYSL